jgi:large repetitive protein
VTVTRAHGADVAGLSSTFSRSGSSPSVTAAANVTPPVAADRKAPTAARGTTPAVPGSSGPGTPTAPATAPSSPVSTSGHTPTGSSSGLSIGTSFLLRAASEGASYASSVTVSGGNGPYAWSATGLPPGLTASPHGSTLDIGGMPTAAGIFNVILSVTDSASPAHSATDSVTVYVTLLPVRATVNAPATAHVGQPYSGTVTATGGDGTYNWSTTFLAPGLTATAHGATLTISGAPVVGGEPVLSGTVSDGESPAQFYNWVIPLTVS